MSKKNILEQLQALFEEASAFSEKLDNVYGVSPQKKAKLKKRRDKYKNASELFKEGIEKGKKREKKRIKERAKAAKQKQEEGAKAALAARAQQADFERRQNESATRAAEAKAKRKAKQLEKALEKARNEERAKAEREKKAEKQAAMKRSAKDASKFHPRQPAYLPKCYVPGPAIILKPKMDCVATKKEALKLGGLPQLPADIAWPGQDSNVAYHFYAQLDFAALPRVLSGPGYHFDMPRFPDSGTLFVFILMNDIGMYELEPKVIFVPGSVSHLPERQPPGNLPVLTPENATELNIEGIAPGGRMVRRQYLQPLPYMSTRPPNYSPEERKLRENPPKQDADVVAALLNANLELTLNEDTTNPPPGPDHSSWDRYVGQSTLVPPSEHPIDSPHRFKGDVGQMQMFGHGDDVQNASAQHADKIMLLQVGNGFGAPVRMTQDVVIQVWIKPDDLAQGRFDRVAATMDCS